MEQNTIRDKVAAEVRATLGRSQMTAAELARETGLSKAAVSRKLGGLTSFTVEEIIKVSKATGVSIDSLVSPAVPRSTERVA